MYYSDCNADFKNRKEMEELFLPSLEGVAKVMKNQLRLAQEKGCNLKVTKDIF